MIEYVICNVCGEVLEQVTDSHLKQHNMSMKEYKRLYPDSATISDDIRQKIAESKRGKIRCEVCGKVFREISYNHVRQHNMTLDEYKSQFPDAPIRSLETQAKRDQQSLEHSKKMSGERNPFYGKTHDEETRKIMSEQVKMWWDRERERLLEIFKESGKLHRGENHPLWKGGYEAGVGSGDPKFKARRRALRIHGHRCMIPECDFDLVIHNHHIIPRHEGGSHSLENCILLCPNHHAMADADIFTREYLSQIVQQSLTGKQNQ